MTNSPGAWASVIGYFCFLALVAGAASFGGIFRPGAWFEGLHKPVWNPPNWVFAPVWTLLYIMIATSGWAVWRRIGLAAAALPLSVWLLQLVLNALWSWLFFGLHRPAAALAEILLLFAAILACVVIFRRTSLTASLLLVPYLLWVAFAAILNFALWRLNR